MEESSTSTSSQDVVVESPSQGCWTASEDSLLLAVIQHPSFPTWNSVANNFRDNFKDTDECRKRAKFLNKHLPVLKLTNADEIDWSITEDAALLYMAQSPKKFPSWVHISEQFIDPFKIWKECDLRYEWLKLNKKTLDNLNDDSTSVLALDSIKDTQAQQKIGFLFDFILLR
jgi:hypothetical protein